MQMIINYNQIILMHKNNLEKLELKYNRRVKIIHKIINFN